nr:glucan endo-1,3-beta-glucosidase, basic vacuolar isoform [Quercus suber]
MQNIHNAIVSANLQDQIKVSTSIDMSLLGNLYPPSAGSFSDRASSYMASVVTFLANNGAPLLANVYPYFSYIGNSQSISLDYVLLRSPGVVVQDGEYGYQNLFDAILDALYSALEKSGGSNVKVVVSESGWPSEGHAAATIDNAATYYQNLINHVNSGTPKRPGQAIQTYLFAMFDENKNGPEETERHFARQSIGVIYGTVADDLPPAIETNIIPYIPDVKISYIAAGNEIKPSDPLAQYVGLAIQNLNNEITGVVVQDGNLGYQNLFDAIVDVLYSALEKIGGANLTVIVTESGWPSDGNGGVVTVDNAGTYYKNLISHVKNGTPKRPRPLETYLFALFDEDQKGPAETEKHYGLFSPTKQPKYQLSFT